MDRKDWTLNRAIEVKLPWLRAVPAWQEWILPLEKWIHFFLRSLAVIVSIYRHFQSNGANWRSKKHLTKKIYIMLYYIKKNLSMFDTSPVVSIWLKMSINWHTKSQGPKKKCTHFSRGRIHSCPADTACNQGSFTSMALWSVQSFLSSTVHKFLPIGGFPIEIETKISKLITYKLM